VTVTDIYAAWDAQKQATTPTAPITPIVASEATPYGHRALEQETARVANAPEGTRNDTLNRAAFNLAQLVQTGHLTETETRQALENAARTAGLPPAEIDATLASAGRAAPAKPRVNVPSPDETLPHPIPDVTTITTPDRDSGDTDEEEAARTSWWPRDLTAAIDGTNPEPAPSILPRTDGQHLLYRAKVNGFIGPSESGKTWVALAAVQDTLHSGGTVTYIDFEDTETGIVTRLQNLSTPNKLIAENLHYIGPDQALDTIAAGDLQEHLTTVEPDLIIIDGFNAAMTLLGLDLMSNTDATTFAQRLLSPLARLPFKPAVAYVDHVPKSRDHETAGGIGAQAKRAMTTGAAYSVSVIKPFGKGQNGLLRLHVDKDRAGHIRGASLPGNSTHWAADIQINSDPTGQVDLIVLAPQDHDKNMANFRPTVLMDRVSAFLENMQGPVTSKAIEDGVRGKRGGIRQAVEILVTEGYVKREAGARGAVLHSLVKPYSEPISDTGRPEETGSNTDLAPSPPPRPHLAPGEVAVAGDVAPVLGSRHKASPTGARSASGPHNDVKTGDVAPEEIKTINGQRVNIRTGEVLDQ